MQKLMNQKNSIGKTPHHIGAEISGLLGLDIPDAQKQKGESGIRDAQTYKMTNGGK